MLYICFATCIFAPSNMWNIEGKHERAPYLDVVYGSFMVLSVHLSIHLPSISVHLLRICEGLTHHVIHMHTYTWARSCRVHVCIYELLAKRKLAGCTVSQEQAEYDFSCSWRKECTGSQTVLRASERLQFRYFTVGLGTSMICATCTCTYVHVP